jgi:hypothetical protein
LPIYHLPLHLPLFPQFLAPQTLSSWGSLALVLEEGKYEGAEKMFLLTLKGREKVLGAEHPEMLSSFIVSPSSSRKNRVQSRC